MPVSYDPAKDPYKDLPPSELSPATKGFAVTPSDTSDFATYAKSLRINQGGSIRFLPILADDAAPLTWDVQAGDYILLQVRKVFATGTTATGITGLSD